MVDFCVNGLLLLIETETQEGFVICVNDEHSLKAESPIEVTDEGIVISTKERHLENVYSFISVIKGGIFIFHKMHIFLSQL